MSLTVQRPLVAQEFTTQAFTVTTAPQSPAQALSITSMIDVFMITVPSTAANSIFLGSSQAMTTATGIELLAGTTVQFRIDHDGRQLYEIQMLLREIAACITGRNQPVEAIPFVVWDMSQVYLVAAANTAISIGLFKAVYI